MAGEDASNRIYEHFKKEKEELSKGINSAYQRKKTTNLARLMATVSRRSQQAHELAGNWKDAAVQKGLSLKYDTMVESFSPEKPKHSENPEDPNYLPSFLSPDNLESSNYLPEFLRTSQ